MPSSLMILFLANVLMPFGIMHDNKFIIVVSAILMFAGTVVFSRKVADHFAPQGPAPARADIDKKRLKSLVAPDNSHDNVMSLCLLITISAMVLFQLSFYNFQKSRIKRSGINLNATVSNVFYEKKKQRIVRVIEYTYTVGTATYKQQCAYRDENNGDSLPIRLLPDFPELHYIRNYTLRKPPLHHGRAVDYNRICYPYTPPAALSEKITRAPWAISYREYGPWDMNLNPVLVVIFPEGDRLKKVTMYHPDFTENAPSEIAETTITGLNEKLAWALAYKLRSGNFPTEENPKDKLARRRFYHSSRYNFRIYSRGITRDLFYNNAVHYFDAPDKEQAEAAIKLMRTLRDE